MTERKADPFMPNPWEHPLWARSLLDACWEEVKQNKSSGRWSHCRLVKGHEGDCVDADGWLRDNH